MVKKAIDGTRLDCPLFRRPLFLLFTALSPSDARSRSLASRRSPRTHSAFTHTLPLTRQLKKDSVAFVLVFRGLFALGSGLYVVSKAGHALPQRVKRAREGSGNELVPPRCSLTQPPRKPLLLRFSSYS